MVLSDEVYAELKRLGEALLDERGREICDPDPIAVPGGLRKPETLKEQIQRILRIEVSKQALDQGYESFNESQDFDVPDEEGDPLISAYVMEDEIPKEMPGGGSRNVEVRKEDVTEPGKGGSVEEKVVDIGSLRRAFADPNKSDDEIREMISTLT